MSAAELEGAEGSVWSESKNSGSDIARCMGNQAEHGYAPAGDQATTSAEGQGLDFKLFFQTKKWHLVLPSCDGCVKKLAPVQQLLNNLLSKGFGPPVYHCKVSAQR